MTDGAASSTRRIYPKPIYLSEPFRPMNADRVPLDSYKRGGSCRVRIVDRQSQIRAAQHGDLDARNALGRWLHTELVAFFSTRYSRDQLDELIQETMKDIMAKLATHAPDDPDAFLVWARSFAGTTARASGGEVRRVRARQAKLRAQIHLPPRSPGTRLLREERRQLLHRHLPQLPAIYRDALEHHLDGGDNQSFANRAQIPEGTARRRLWRAKLILRRLVMDARVTRTSQRTPTALT